ncbi:MAG: FMN-binding glutamate synthase family protein [Planctomycetota bacterium]
MRFLTFGLVVLAACALVPLALSNGGAWWWGAGAAAALALLGVYDLVQPKHALLRNYPIIGHGRYLMEAVRPEIRQYFIEDDTDGRPYDREQRSLIYQRAKGQSEYDAFGSELRVGEVGYEWLEHSLAARDLHHARWRVTFGEGTCAQPYSAALFNISAMSFGSLGPRAIESLSAGAREGEFWQNTGEGGVSRYHLAGGGDLVWQLGTGYFGARRADGGFDEARFKVQAAHERVRMIEVKLSQGAKPGHGGILPANKITDVISEARGVPKGKDCMSPPGHSAFSTPRELVRFVARLREVSGGKPVGIKLCVGRPVEVLALVKAMHAEGEAPDFITVDGGEGGTGAAPVEFADHMGTPLREGLVLVRDALVGAGLRDRVRLVASAKVVTAMDIARLIALGADTCNAARSFMIALGCIQAQVCHTNECPAGVATLDPSRNRAIHVPTKSERVRRFQAKTLDALAEIVGATGLSHPHELTPDRFLRRTGLDDVRSLAELHPPVARGALLDGHAPERLQHLWDQADPDAFAPRGHVER